MPDPDELLAELAAREVPDGPEPCYGCECCRMWIEMLEVFKTACERHVAGELRVSPCSADCLVCGAVGTEWQRGPGG